PGPKSGEKGFAGAAPPAAQQGHCADVASGILQSASNLCGMLVVAVVAPLCGDGSARSGACQGQRLAMAELRRLVDQRQQQERSKKQQTNKEEPRAASGDAGTQVPAE